MQLSYLERFSPGLIFHKWGKTFLSIVSNAPWIYKIFLSDSWEQELL